MDQMDQLEQFFRPFRDNIVGGEQTFCGPYGERRIVYADWTASGRLYRPIERTLSDLIGPFVGNTHSESSVTGTTMTHAYHYAQHIIKQHCNAGSDDVIITAGAGMTALINKFQRILGLRLPDQLQPFCTIPDEQRPVVFVTHMEHHSNQTSWLETIAEVVCVEPDEQGLVAVDQLRAAIAPYADRLVKIGSFTACSNVTGIPTPYHELARVMHQHGGVCFVDFAASAPYVPIDMHPSDPHHKLDAIFFSPHKFLGGPGACGVLIFDRALYHAATPDQPGGGTVAWTNPWHGHRYLDDIEAREDGGTPAFLQTIKAALAIRLKEAMGTDQIAAREAELVPMFLGELRRIPSVHVLADHVTERLPIVSFYVEDVHYNLLVKLLNDRWGVQVRGGCSCAGTYGHYLLHVDPQRSQRITDKIDHGDLSEKPGWVRASLHPTTTTADVRYLIDAIRETVANAARWQDEYVYVCATNEFQHRRGDHSGPDVNTWFDADRW